MKTASAFAPGNISCFFVIKRTSNPMTSGSLGLGFTINKGVQVSAAQLPNRNEKDKVLFNNKSINFPTVLSVIKKLAKKPVLVKIRTDLPLGSGFGVSGASALALSYALNKLFGLNKTKKELAMVAHSAEVENLTGLGDVTNQYLGGFLVKYESSYKFKAKRLPFAGKMIHYRVFSALKTKSIIQDKMRKDQINKIGLQKLVQLKKTKKKNILLPHIIDLSYEFADESGLLQDQRVNNAIDSLRTKGGHASMIMLGNSVFSDTPFPGCKKAIISNRAAHLL